MESSRRPEIVVSGLGVTSAIGQGKAAFTSALLEGRHRFGVMRRPGRQWVPAAEGDGGPARGTAFLGAEIADLTLPPSMSAGSLRNTSLSSQVALATLHEAWNDARLDAVDPARIGLVVGGSNFQQRELVRTHDAHANRVPFLRPTYGMSFMDSDLCGVCTERFGIGEFAYTVGGASASGQVAVIHALQAVQSGRVDVCIALGALMDLSYWECQGFRSLGAMGSDRFADSPAQACRPFDRRRDGFIYGEACGTVIVERLDSATSRGATAYARLAGSATQMDRNRNPNPSFDGEVRVLQKCLAEAGLAPGEIDYINPHGTGSTLGDETELRAIRHCGLDRARLNASKSILGHGLSAAGVVELIATLVQMSERRLHPTLNLEEPIEPSCEWVRERAADHSIVNALNLSMGFGGVNTAVCLQRL